MPLLPELENDLGDVRGYRHGGPSGPWGVRLEIEAKDQSETWGQKNRRRLDPKRKTERITM